MTLLARVKACGLNSFRTDGRHGTWRVVLQNKDQVSRACVQRCVRTCCTCTIHHTHTPL